MLAVLYFYRILDSERDKSNKTTTKRKKNNLKLKVTASDLKQNKNTKKVKKNVDLKWVCTV